MEAECVVATENATSETANYEHPMDTDAWKWMSDQNTFRSDKDHTAVFSPILYVGRRKIEDLYKILGRPLRLDEVKHLVQIDGGIEKCELEGIRFQPVRYLAFITPKMKEELYEGKSLADIKLPYGGSFHLRDGKIFAVSGSVFAFSRKLINSEYPFCNKSPLVTVAFRCKANNGGKLLWGISRDYADGILRRMQIDRENRKRKAREKLDRRNMRIDRIFGNKPQKRNSRSFNSTVGELIADKEGNDHRER